MSGFEPYRAAARQGVLDAGMKPIIIEDFPSLDLSSRTACLDLVKSSDVYVVVIGDRPGSSPLGKPVVEEEFEEARSRKLPRLLFIQNTTRNPEAEALVHRLSDFVHGRFRATFQAPADLRAAVTAAFRGLPASDMDKNEPSLIQQLLDTRTYGSTALLRVAVAPERKDDVFDVLDFDRQEFRRSILQLAHADAVRLLDFEQGPKTAEVKDRELIVRQEDGSAGRRISVALRLREDGVVVVDQALDERRENRRPLGLDFQIEEHEVGEAVRSALSFVNALYEQRDRGHRYSTFFYGAAVAGMSMRMIVREVHDMQSWSFPTDDRGWYIPDKPRRLDRTDLANPADTVERTLAFIVKRYGRRR
jgi:Domain of unknown function (DUF4062)